MSHRKKWNKRCKNSYVERFMGTIKLVSGISSHNVTIFMKSCLKYISHEKKWNKRYENGYVERYLHTVSEISMSTWRAYFHEKVQERNMYENGYVKCFLDTIKLFSGISCHCTPIFMKCSKKYMSHQWKCDRRYENLHVKFETFPGQNSSCFRTF